MDLNKRLDDIYRLAVMSNEGRRYMPIYRNNEIFAYARHKKAVAECIHSYNVWVSEQRRKREIA